ncbi:DUF397 domain-containing protein [Actinomadura sp. WMMB 499]|uniref:DUF397 domain-containing protein n=1 Tax=Actinomadura sp. WMMB 499 TaxID=1219491 RepID=UPI001249197B|nr:DUF397 domain-containing protein [Actinomadura sp. WMMB 499]QFG21489.1 DUF397 domain-containing protein [Actinomadura sp. WMMB 499]
MIVQWRKSSYSGVGDDVCVELGRLARGVGVRDSKAPGAGHLALSAAEFAGLVGALKRLPAR